MVLEKPIPNADKTLLRYSATPARSVTSTTKRLPVGIGKSERCRCFHAVPSGNKSEYGKQASEVFAVLINKDKAQAFPYLMLTLSLRKPSLPTTGLSRQKRTLV